MKRVRTLAAAIALMLMAWAGMARAADVSFNIEIPTIPYPPTITEVNNSAIAAGANEFTVTAKIVGQMQKRPYCPKPNKDDCELADWTFIDEPGVTPNPPDIKVAKVYYYKKTPSTPAPASVDMVKDASLGENMWKATVPLPASVEGDIIVYYIVAVDGRGNVSSQVPDTGSATNLCPSTPTAQWPTVYSTPATSNCTNMTSYSQCQVNVPGSPTCGSTFTMNDKTGDVCGESDANGVAHILSPQTPKTDMLGISALADKDYLCTNVGLGASPPGPSDPSPIEGYLTIIFNPDIFDDNPADLWIKNAYGVSFAPEVVGTDQTLVRVLWDANCLTNPNTPNVLDCKLITVTGSDPRLQIGYGSSLVTIVKKSGTGNPYAVAYNLIGSTSKLSYLVGVTGEIQLSGGTPFWFADLTAGMGFYHTNQERTVTSAPPPAPPTLTSTKCSADGTGQGTPDPKKCNKSTTQPTKNVCKLSWNSSLDKAFTSEYRIYMNTTNTFPGGSPMGNVADVDATPSYSYNADISTLDGKKTYFFVTSYNSANSKESPSAQVSPTYCISEDWVPPLTPSITTAKTPAGNEKKCELAFTMPGTDESLKSFYMKRNGTAVNFTNPMGADPGATSFSWVDADELTINTAYTYTVTAVDLGNNQKESSSMSCTPEDLKAPGLIDSVVGANLSGKLGVHLEWQASTESDLAGYYAYKCSNANANSCKVFGDFTAMNTSLTSSTYYESESGFEDADYCFYVAACDNCKTAGTCNSNPPNTSNCSSFPSGGKESTLYVKCMRITSIPDELKPAFPSNVAALTPPPPEGRKCKLTWTKNEKHTTGANFCDPSPCEGPIASKDLNGYKIMRCQGSGCVVPSPSEGTPVGTVALGPTGEQFEDKTVINGTTYRYAVYAADSSGNVSENGLGGNKTEVDCTPADTIAPTTPTQETVVFDESSCTLAWNDVTDPDTLTYTMYRCDGDFTTCNASNKYTEATGCTMDGTSCREVGLDADAPYSYCVIATDQANPPNSSTIFSSTSHPNCAVCTPSNRPAAPTDMTAAVTQDKLGATMFWTLSTGDDHSSGGYNIYRCTDAECTSKTKVSGKACTNLAASSSQIQNIGAGAPISLPSEPCTSPGSDYYYGITYQKDCVEPLSESSIDVSDKVSLECATLPSDCASAGKCVVVSSCTTYSSSTGCDPVKEIDTAQKDASGFIKTAKSGITVMLYKSDGTPLGGSTVTDANGNFELKIDTTENPISSSEKYKIVMKIPAADKAGFPCTPGFTGDDCIIVIKESTVSEDSTVLKISAPAIPKTGGGRAEVGNANCDNKVNLSDFTILKQSFGKNVGSGGQAFADFNGDGKVNLSDFTILKQNFGRNLDASPSFVTDLCKPQ